MRKALLAGLIGLAVISPFLVRNYLVWGDLRLTAQPGFNFLFYEVRAVAARNGAVAPLLNGDNEQQEESFLREAEQRGISTPINFRPYALADFAAKEGVDILNHGFWTDYVVISISNMLTHPFDRTPWFILSTTAYDWGAPSKNGLYRVYERLHLAWRLVCLPLILLGCAVATRRRMWRLLVPLGGTAFLHALVAAPINDSRTWLPELVLMAPFAALGLDALVSGVRALRWPPRRHADRA